MFCNHCGADVRQNAKFCPNCGREVSASESEPPAYVQPYVRTPAHDTGNSEFDRDVMVQYLYNLRTLEIAKAKLLEKQQKQFDKYNRLGIAKTISQPQGHPIASIVSGCVLIGASLVGTIGLIFAFFHQNDSLEIWSLVTVILTIIPFPLSFGILFLIRGFSKRKAQQEAERLKQADNARVQKEIFERQKLRRDIENLQKEINKADALLQKAYSVNIVPAPYRNIQAVFYLYEYLSTSYETIQNALLHCNFNEMKMKMDVVIQQQSDMLLEQAVQSARLEDMRTQNSRLLQHAAATERNTALAAKYSRIAANNAEVNAWIGLANYFKD